MKKIGAILGGLLLALGITFVTAEPAAANPWDCPVGVMCAWNDYLGQGTQMWIYSFSGSGGTNHCVTLSGSADNNWDSMRNDFGHDGRPVARYQVFLYSDSFCNTYLGGLNHGDWNFYYYTQYRKVVSSYKIYGPCAC